MSKTGNKPATSAVMIFNETRKRAKEIHGEPAEDPHTVVETEKKMTGKIFFAGTRRENNFN